MSEIHVVRSGESLSGIARSYGFADWRAIYDHQANASLREARPDPAMIHPGDRVFIPDRVETVHSATTDQRHTVTVPAPPEEGEPHLRNVTILVHGVNTTAGWFGLIEGEEAITGRHGGDAERDAAILLGEEGLEARLRREDGVVGALGVGVLGPDAELGEELMADGRGGGRREAPRLSRHCERSEAIQWSRHGSGTPRR